MCNARGRTSPFHGLQRQDTSTLIGGGVHGDRGAGTRLQNHNAVFSTYRLPFLPISAHFPGVTIVNHFSLFLREHSASDSRAEGVGLPGVAQCAETCLCPPSAGPFCAALHPYPCTAHRRLYLQEQSEDAKFRHLWGVYDHVTEVPPHTPPARCGAALTLMPSTRHPHVLGLQPAPPSTPHPHAGKARPPPAALLQL